MRPDKRGVLELFERPQRYVIPLYQRRYVWTKEKQWEPLWNDIRRRAEAEVENRGHVKPHFLGAVVLANIRTYGRQLQAYDVIDGQQRLTTFQLFLAAFRDIAGELEIHTLERELGRVTRNDGALNDELEQYKVWPTRFDQPGFQRVLDRTGDDPIEQDVTAAHEAFRFVANTTAAYAYFCQELRTWLTESRDPRLQGEALFTALRRYLQVVTIELEDDDDPQVIFETLNARGEPLQPADLVRNHIFSDAAQRGEKVDSLFEHYWAQFDADGSLWRTDEARGRVTRPQLAWFLMAFLTVKLEEDISDGVIFDAFKRWWGSRGPEATAEAGLKELLRYARAYQDLLESKPETRLGVFFRRLKVMDISTLTPLLLYLLTDAGLSGASLNVVLDDLESYVIRRFGLGLGSKNYNLLFVRLLREVRDLPPGADVRQFMLNFLSRGKGDSVRWPTDEEWRSGLLTTPIYKKVRPRGVSMLLEAIDLHRTTGKQEALLIAAPLSVEHVLPQKWITHWPAPVASGEILDAAAWRNTLLHTLGNLTLTTQKLNTALSNGAYENKRVALAGESRLRLNTLFQTQMKWDETVIQRRSEELADDLLLIWHGPEGQVAPQGVSTALEISTDAYTTIEALREDLKLNTMPSFAVGGSAAGGDVQLFNNDWGSRGARYHAEVVEDDTELQRIRVSLRDTFTEQSPQKPWVKLAMARLAFPVQQTFGLERAEVNPSELTVWLPGDSDVTTVRRALSRLIALTLPAMEHAAAQSKQRRPAGQALDDLINTLSPCLPEPYYFMVADIGMDRNWRRLAHAEWPNTLHYEFQIDSGNCTLILDDELQNGPLKTQVGKRWEKLMAAAQATFPTLSVTGGTRGRSNHRVTLNFPGPLTDQELCEQVTAFIKATSPILEAALTAVNNETSQGSL